MKIDVQNVVAEHFSRIHRAALVLSGNPWDADDLAQETFLAFAAQVDRFERRSSVYTYLYGILLNLDRRERRRSSIHQRKLRVLYDKEPSQQKMVPAAELRIEVAEWKKSLWTWVDKLPDGQRQVLVLRFSEGLKYEEIAEAMECPLGTVKSRIFHGLSGLRQMLEQESETKQRLTEFINEDLSNAV